MLINNYFKNEEQNIRNHINNIPILNCLDNFFSYLNTRYNAAKGNEVGDFEKKYIGELYDNVHLLLRDLFKKHYEEKTKEELINKLMDYEEEGGAIVYMDVDTENYINTIEWLCNNDKKAIHDLIVKYMLDTLDNMLAKEMETNQEIEAKKIKEKIEGLKRNIEYNKQQIEKSQRALADLIKEQL